MLNFSEYQQEARKTAIYPKEYSIIYPALGLNGEAGEVAEKIKKLIRDGAIEELQDESFRENNPNICATVIDMVTKEMGDVLWYLAALASDLGVDLADVAAENIAKLSSRQQRNKLSGSGDER